MAKLYPGNHSYTLLKIPLTVNLFLLAYFSTNFSVLKTLNVLFNGDRIRVDVMTGEHLSSIQLANVNFIYWLAHLSSRRGGDWLKGVDTGQGTSLFKPVLLEYMKIWCNIQVKIYRFFSYLSILNEEERGTNKTFYLACQKFITHCSVNNVKTPLPCFTFIIVLFFINVFEYIITLILLDFHVL